MKKEAIDWREILSYIVFGVLTTVVSIGVFEVLKPLIGNYLVRTVISWFFAVLFAYVTNKRYVFKKTNQTKDENMKEILSFYSVRILSLGIEFVSMIILVELVSFSESWAKILTQFIIVVANYVFSKLFVFNKNSTV